MVEKETIVYLKNEEDNNDGEVSMEEYLQLKIKKKQAKESIVSWYQQFERVNERPPEVLDFNQIRL